MFTDKSIEKIKQENTVDFLVTMIVDELSKVIDESPDKLLIDFMSSETGKLLFDSESRLWWNGPSYIAEMYLKEKNIR